MFFQLLSGVKVKFVHEMMQRIIYLIFNTLSAKIINSHRFYLTSNS